MIQDTTLRMVVRAVDEATQPLEDVKKSLDEVNGGLENVQKTAGEALPAIGKGATTASDGFDDLGAAAKGAAFHIGPGTIEAVAAAGVALVALANYVKDAAEEHLRLMDIADRLDLPYDAVKDYSEAWMDVAIALNDAARGYKELNSSQAAVLKGLGLDPSNQGEFDRIRKLVAVGEGTRQEKIDVFRRVFGMSYEEAARELDTQINKFYTAAALGGYNPAVSGAQPTVDGITARSLNVSQLLNSGRVQSPLQVKQLQDDQREAERAIADINRAVAQEQAKAARQAEQDKKARDRASLDAMRDKADAEAGILQQGYKSELALDKATNQAIIEGDKEVAAASKDAWKLINDDTAASLRQMVIPVNEFVESWKDAMKDMVYFGDFSFKRLVARIVVNLTSKELFSAIDKVGDALDAAFSKASGSGGGFLGAAKSFLGSLFGGKAGGGQAQGWTLVGEDGPELAYFGAGGRVMNQRQMAFAGVGQGGGSVTHVTNHYAYSISGVETQQVVAYIERTRREDQKANVKMLERNGLGRMR